MRAFGVVARPKVPEGYVGVWVNMYIVGKGKNLRIHAGGAYEKRIHADNIAKPHRLDCVFTLIKLK